jgi:hypothetical protein
MITSRQKTLGESEVYAMLVKWHNYWLKVTLVNEAEKGKHGHNYW